MEHGKCDFSIIKEGDGDNEFSRLTLYVLEDNPYYSDSDYINLKIIEQKDKINNLEVYLGFYNLSNKKVLTHSISIIPDKKSLKLLRKFILKIKENDGFYYLKICIADTDLSYSFFVNSNTNEVVPVN